MKDPGLLIVVSGPSGAGKGTICDALRKRFPNINYSISMTTRSPRPGEQDGINYFFSDNAHFEELLAQDAFLEHAKVYDHYYGKHVMLEIDIQGAMQVKQKYPQGVFIYIVPPSMDVLARRLRDRKTDTEEVIAGRLSKASDELQWIEQYDYLIVNDDLASSIDEAAAILTAEEMKTSRNTCKIAAIRDLYKK